MNVSGRAFIEFKLELVKVFNELIKMKLKVIYHSKNSEKDYEISKNLPEYFDNAGAGNNTDLFAELSNIVQVVVTNYENKYLVCIDQGGDNQNYELDLCDVDDIFNRRELAKKLLSDVMRNVEEFDKLRKV